MPCQMLERLMSDFNSQHIQFRELHENLEAIRKKLTATENEIYVLKENESR